MKNIVILFVAGLLFPFIALAQQEEKKLITVTGEAEVRVVPDEVIITIGVETREEELDSARKENDNRTKKIINTAKEYKIESKHIQTDYLGIEPIYSDSYEYRNKIEDYKIIGYLVRKTIVITVRDLSLFESLLTDLLKAGANHVHGISFRTTELRKYRDEARLLAIKAAKEKAAALAGELGQKIGDPYHIQENGAGWWSGYNSWWGSRWSGGMSQNVAQNMGDNYAGDSEGTIAPGQIKVNASVTVSFELE
ncbi:MAG: SIMPL domain-containing protein [Calditrichaceae bacterium]|nr:SIMPL domain-containing protein [Calditrichaceae bacterium]MBN2707850.1 SIMPL domain-containing protein [Calditrichaceae bacterium]RQV94916.1 MAG: DUF541 domain-containing protein [Calditrichota bacterium]